MIRALTIAALRFRLIIAGLAAGLLAVGIFSLPQMHDDVLPELTRGPVLEVQTEALGLSGNEVEQYVTVPMENNLLDGVMGVWDVRSRSTPGLSTIDLYFEPGTTTFHARQLVEERLTNAFSLPQVSKPPLLIQPLSSSSRAMLISLSSAKIDPLELSYLARWIVKPKLSGVAGVANVAIFGQQDRQIQVLVDPDRLAARHIILQQIINTAGNAQLVSPLSYLEGSAPGTGGFLDNSNQRLEIRPVLPLGAPTDLATVPIAGAPGKLQLGSVAQVVKGHQPLIGDALGSGTARSELLLLVQKLPSASIRGVTDGIDRALADLRPALADVRIDSSFFRPATYEADSLHNLALALIIAAGLALVALVALLLDLRSTVIAAVSIACSLLAAALTLQLLGQTLNAMVVLGLLVASGVVVDDAVVGTGETVAELRARSGDERRVPLERVILGTCSRLRGTLGYATLIAVLAVAPVLVAHGLTASYLHPLVLAFALAIAASALTALLLTPGLGLLLLKPPGDGDRRLDPLGWVGDAYRRVLSASLGIGRVSLICICVLGLAAFIALPFLQQPRPPQFRDRSLVVQWDGPPGASLSEMDRITRRVLASVRALPAVSDAAATLGRAVSADQIVDTSSGQIYVSIRRSADYDRAVASLRSVVESVSGMHASVSTYEQGVQAGVLADRSHDLTVRLYGQDYAELDKLAKQLDALMAGVYGLGQPQIHLPIQQPGIVVTVNDAAAHNAGVLPGDARRQASTLVSGLTVGNFFADQAVFDVVVIGTPSLRNSIDAVRNLSIDTSGGGHVRLSQIAAVGVGSDPADIQHEGLSRYVDVTVPIYSGTTSAAGSSMRERIAQMQFPLDYHAELVGSTPEEPTTHLVLLSFVLAAAVGIFLLMQAAFGSWRLASLLMLALPISLAGGLIVAIASGDADSLGCDAGLLGVLALAVRQGMLQIAAARRVQSETGGGLGEAIIATAPGRFAASLSSSMLLAVMLTPFAVMGNAAGGELTHIAAIVMLGGLLTSTLVNGLLIPSMCAALGPLAPLEHDAVADEADHHLTAQPANAP